MIDRMEEMNFFHSQSEYQETMGKLQHHNWLLSQELSADAIAAGEAETIFNMPMSPVEQSELAKYVAVVEYVSCCLRLPRSWCRWDRPRPRLR